MAEDPLSRARNHEYKSGIPVLSCFNDCGTIALMAAKEKEEQVAKSEILPAATTDTPHDPRPSPAEERTINWTASEFIAHQKSIGWYAALAAVAVIVAGLIYVLTKDKISTIVVLIGALALGFYGARQPRQLDYRLDSAGVTIGSRYHGYEEFRSFAIVPEGAFSSIVFMPLKRFALLTTIYYAPADEDKIVQLLSNILPLEQHRLDPVDQLMRRIRF